VLLKYVPLRASAPDANHLMMIHDSVDDSSLHCIASWLCCQWLKSPAAYLLYGFIVKLGAAAPHTHTSLDLFINLRLEEPKPIILFFFILKSRVWFWVCHTFGCAWKRFRFSLLFYFIFCYGYVGLCIYSNSPEKVSVDDTG